MKEEDKKIILTDKVSIDFVMDTSSIFYKMANFSGEVARMMKAYDMNKPEAGEKFKDNAMQIADAAIISDQISSAGHEEWYTIRNLLEGYREIDLLKSADAQYMKRVLLKFGEPFAMAFAYKMHA